MIYILFETRYPHNLKLTRFITAYEYYDDALYDAEVENILSPIDMEVEYWVKSVQLL